ncbi:hypothetical protein MJ717_003918 [Cronobacter sakazakii]|uniref:hypothetical protein n=1 Tax=Cronobacter malonaticus TaxID=413503 RepID=UPI001319EBCC|nr:hypothetical protein [Cronobacter malonaticus]EIX1505828.1 hypothetical protein [Cronobacter sakazakii]EIX1527442.1 hypothetical protein [Cronobacter sakazakii]EIX1536016.1 hypothetical protein [Cronobacter sakazakii]EIX1624582.1 hypothetical protein [Cronobacter sakazakii]EIX1665949.1 hypothetical protein [Cronobacter sakazakii]
MKNTNKNFSLDASAVSEMRTETTYNLYQESNHTAVGKIVVDKHRVSFEGGLDIASGILERLARQNAAQSSDGAQGQLELTFTVPELGDYVITIQRKEENTTENKIYKQKQQVEHRTSECDRLFTDNETSKREKTNEKDCVGGDFVGVNPHFIRLCDHCLHERSHDRCYRCGKRLERREPTGAE